MKKVTFAVPEGMEVPQDIEPGGTFEAVASLKLEDNGKLCLVALDGESVAGYEAEAEVVAEVVAEDEGYLSAVEKGMK